MHNLKDVIEQTLIEIKKFVKPDLVIIESRTGYSSLEYYKMSFIFNEELMAEQQCDQDGLVINEYKGINYYGCKIVKDKVVYLNPRFGWIIHSEATSEYRDMIVDKELLG